ncbi:hypothetical protein COO60DRAFT_1074230 [Scenedesmus sp. NREL 46B-D3]|nr:hypothetical protein COO60DRAFT_1074230 [Scenedesmus sp. NREL 46B-D3]
MKPRDDRAGGHGVPRVMASAPSVVQQARLMDAAGTAWHAVKCGNLEMITKLFPVPCNVYARGPVGENVMHVAMLLNTPSTLAITRYLVKLYGRQLVNCPIQERKQQHDPPGTYEGQTALHIAIVNRDFDMVKFLVQNGADIRARAWGTFFRQGGPMYYGEYALSFAACTGQKDVVAYLRRHGAQVNSDCDEFGNTALHMCVIHDQAGMYDFLVDYCAASEAVRSQGGLTPLCLAAQLGKADMLQHVYSRRRRAFYSFGKVTSYSLSLREIDTVQDEDEAAGPDGGYVPNALEAVLRKRHLDMLQEPLLTLLLQHKWEKFARYQLVVHFLGYLLLEVSQTILIWLHSSPGMWNGPGRASQEFLGIILALALLAVEVLDYANWSRECYHRRLTMTLHKEVDPPLYPIPGEMRDARDNRQGLFARLSARMGFAANSSGTQQSGPGGWQQRSEGGLGTPRTAAAAARGTSHPGAGSGLSGSSAAWESSNSSETQQLRDAWQWRRCWRCWHVSSRACQGCWRVADAQQPVTHLPQVSRRPDRPQAQDWHRARRGHQPAGSRRRGHRLRRTRHVTCCRQGRSSSRVSREWRHQRGAEHRARSCCRGHRRRGGWRRGECCSTAAAPGAAAGARVAGCGTLAAAAGVSHWRAAGSQRHQQPARRRRRGLRPCECGAGREPRAIAVAPDGRPRQQRPAVGSLTSSSISSRQQRGCRGAAAAAGGVQRQRGRRPLRDVFRGAQRAVDGEAGQRQVEFSTDVEHHPTAAAAAAAAAAAGFIDDTAAAGERLAQC